MKLHPYRETMDFSQGGLVMKKPLPIGHVGQKGDVFHNFFKDAATNSDEKDFPNGFEMMEKAQGEHNDW